MFVSTRTTGLPEGEGQNGPGRVGPDTRQREKGGFVFGKAVGLGEDGGGLYEGKRPAIVAEAAPEGEDLGQGRRGQGCRVRVCLAARRCTWGLPFRSASAEA